jgi:RES domain-containing protein
MNVSSPPLDQLMVFTQNGKSRFVDVLITCRFAVCVFKYVYCSSKISTEYVEAIQCHSAGTTQKVQDEYQILR